MLHGIICNSNFSNKKHLSFSFFFKFIIGNKFKWKKKCVCAFLSFLKFCVDWHIIFISVEITKTRQKTTINFLFLDLFFSIFFSISLDLFCDRVLEPQTQRYTCCTSIRTWIELHFIGRYHNVLFSDVRISFTAVGYHMRHTEVCSNTQRWSVNPISLFLAGFPPTYTVTISNQHQRTDAFRLLHITVDRKSWTTNFHQHTFQSLFSFFSFSTLMHKYYMYNHSESIRSHAKIYFCGMGNAVALYYRAMCWLFLVFASFFGCFVRHLFA